MDFIVLGSGSKSNGYIMKATTGETLLIEAGCHLSKVEKVMDYDFSGIVGCIISHCHGDHIGFIDTYLGAGIGCYCNQHVIDFKNLKGHNVHKIESQKQFQIGNFKIKPLEVAHSVPCLAFMIDHPESGRTFFITDSSYSKWNLSKAKIQNWLVECNYDPDILESNYEAGKVVSKVYQHIVSGHFGLHNCKEFFAKNDLSESIRIVLLHKSSTNGNAKKFIREIQGQTGVQTLIAEAGLVIENFGPDPF